MAQVELEGVVVADDRMAVLGKLAEKVGLPHGAVASMLLNAALASPRAAANTLKAALDPAKSTARPTRVEPKVGADEFDQAWAGYKRADGRLGPKALAVASWEALIEATGWTPVEVKRRWAVFTKFTPARFLPEVHRLLRPSADRLTDDALAALERRARAEARAQRPGQGQVEFDAEAYEEKAASRRRGSAPVPDLSRREPPPPELLGAGAEPAGAP